MAEPARKFDDQDEGKKLSAYERAQKSWGISPASGDDKEESGDHADNAVDNEASALERAKDRWGEAGVAGSDNPAKNDAKGSSKDKDNQEDGQADDSVPFRKEGKKGLRARINKKKVAIGGGVIGLAVGGTFGILTIFSGPMQIIQFASLIERFHFGNSEEATNSRVGRMFEYFRTGNDPSKRNVGYTMELITNHYIRGMSRNGVQMNFESPNGRGTRRIQALTIDMSKPGAEDAVNRLRASNFPVDNNGRVDLRQSNTRARRNALMIATEIDTDHKGRLATALQKRMLTHRAGVDFHPLRNIRRTASERLIDWKNARKEERAEKIRSGENAADGRTIQGDTDPDPDNPDAEIPNEANDAAARAGNDLVSDAKSAKSPLQRVRLVGGFAAGGAAVVGALCTVRSMGEDIEQFQHANITLPLIRTAMDIVAIGSQIKTGQDINMEMVGMVAEDFYDEETGTSVMSAPAVKAALGQNFTTAYEVPAKPSDVGDKPALFDIVDNIGPLRPMCAVSDGIGGLLKKIPVVSNVVGWAESGMEAGINLALKPFGYSMESLMTMIISTLAGDIVDPYAKGAIKGGNAFIGGRLAGNDACVAKGCKELTPREEAVLKNYHEENIRKDFEQKSWFARMFDPSETQSFVATAFLQQPSFASLPSFANTITSLPANFMSLFTSAFSNLTPSASAAVNDYEYGVNAYGFTVSELENPNYADPYANMDYVEERLEDLNDQYGDCFSTTINPDTFDIETEETPDFEALSQDKCKGNGEDLTRYRFYLLDTITAKSLACYEGVDEESCSEIGFGDSIVGSSESQSGGSGLVNGEGYSFPLFPQTKAVGGIDFGHHDGTPAFDLFSSPDASVYAIYGGTPIRINENFNDVAGCSSIQFQADDGFFYWYGHLKNVVVEQGVHIEAGTMMAEVADASFGSACVGGGPHLHIDRGCVRDGVPRQGGGDACRDPDFIPFLRNIWEGLPDA